MTRGNTTTRLTQERAAAALGVTIKTLRIWETKPWWPRYGRTSKGYDVDRITAARPKTDVDHDAPESQLRKAARDAEHVKTIEEGKRARIRREHDELKLRVQQGELIPRIGIEQSFADVLTGIADWAEQLPDLFVSMCEVPQKHHRKLRRLLRELIEQKQHDLADELEAKAIARDKEQQRDHG